MKWILKVNGKRSFFSASLISFLSTAADFPPSAISVILMTKLFSLKMVPPPGADSLMPPQWFLDASSSCYLRVIGSNV